MVYRNKLIVMIMLFLGIITLLYFSLEFKMLEYKVFGMIGVVITSILYLVSAFEYYIVDNEKVTYISRLKFKKETIYWRDVNRLTSCSDKYVSAIIIECEYLGGRSITINSWVSGYRKIIDSAIARTKDNKNISIDNQLYNFIK